MATYCIYESAKPVYTEKENVIQMREDGPLPTSQMRHKKCLNLPNYGYGWLNESEDFIEAERVLPCYLKP